jgi:hypothetical protein
MTQNLPTKNNSNTPENNACYSKAKAYSLPIFSCGFALWKIFDPNGNVFCTLAVTNDDIAKMNKDEPNCVDDLVRVLNYTMQD